MHSVKKKAAVAVLKKDEDSGFWIPVALMTGAAKQVMAKARIGLKEGEYMVARVLFHGHLKEKVVQTTFWTELPKEDPHEE
jgi:hypothetical protein